MKCKLIKTYPGFPKLGTIIKINSEQETGYYSENKKFWEEIVEKDYEILSLVSSERNPQHKKGCKFLHNKDYKFKNMHPTEFWDIHSVKRISDNKIFTIGDSYEDLIIEKMFMSVAGDILTTYKPKIKQPLFTTEDGVDIFDYSDSFYWIRKDTLKLCERMTLNTSHSVFFQYEPKKELYFSTKEKAEEYILMNKPCLSINEITNLTETNPPDWLNKELIKIVKSKI
jgi:hypothetical protein